MQKIDPERSNRLIVHMWLGLCLSSMFYYPLTASLSESLYVIHWTDMNFVEFVVAWVGLATIFALGLHLVNKQDDSRRSLLVYMLLVFVPLAFLSVHLARQLGYKASLIGPRIVIYIYLLALVVLILLSSIIAGKNLEKVRPFQKSLCL